MHVLKQHWGLGFVHQVSSSEEEIPDGAEGAET